MSVQMSGEGKRLLQDKTGGGRTSSIVKAPQPSPAQSAAPSVPGGNRPFYEQGRIADPNAANAGIQHKLVDLEFEIKSLELQLERAHAQREILQKQLKEAPDASTSTSPSGQPAPTAPPKGSRN